MDAGDITISAGALLGVAGFLVVAAVVVVIVVPKSIGSWWERRERLPETVTALAAELKSLREKVEGLRAENLEAHSELWKRSDKQVDHVRELEHAQSQLRLDTERSFFAMQLEAAKKGAPSA